ncbi:MAG: hypothetical protein D6736_05710 [Nitrospinota bacterium]|nr:MAG: hypothetical protein D6736_05710 [Nitrospinota bacterium]
MKSIVIGTLLVSLFILFTPVRAGHELPIYPSFYPQEIRIVTVDAREAAAQLPKAAIHAYIGPEPAFDSSPPDNVRFVESLGSYLVLSLAPDAAKDRDSRCTLARTLASTLVTKALPGFRFHPYPITPFHEDYLYHFDLIEAAKAEYQALAADSIDRSLSVHPQGKLATRLVQAVAWPVEEKGKVALEEVDVRALLTTQTLSLNGWINPPWIKQGWFHAYLLLADAISEPARRRAVDALYQRLIRGQAEGKEEQVNIERKLVSQLVEGCERTVVGYTVRREYYNADFSAGVENIAFDSHTGLHAPIFLRTVKLKDFPWNGWLRLGVPTPPSAAWNPVGGFTDPTGRLIWSALGDAALFPAPYNGGWLVNRVVDYLFIHR